MNHMNDKFEQQLEQQLGEELRRLGDVPAPKTLVPRVLATIEATQQEAWWQRPWLAWPRPMQVASTIVLLASTGLMAYGGAGWWNDIQTSRYVAHAGSWVASMTLAADSLVALGRAMVLAGQSAGQQFLLYGLAVCLVMYVSCVGLGTVLYRLVRQQRREA